ncbi:MAG: sigma-70 family RNA polymerase sigma factor [Oscillospiraceae bacterium]|nr:sigma-70 family RNA polymerase sigma factor [Oscillospiraceae bacterium]
MTEFEKIYRDYYGAVYKYILRLSGDESVAEEITCETFFKSMQAIKRFRGDCDIRVWLCQIAKNCYYTYLRKSGKTISTEDEELTRLPSDVHLEEKTVQRDEAMRIRRELHKIPEPYKEVFMWRVFGDLSFKQIGNIFGKTENWACVTYHRAKNMIRSKIEESDSDE